MILAITGACGGTPLLPRIVSQPTSVSAGLGQTATISIVAIGVQIAYQWYKAGALLSGETSTSLVIQDVQESNSGSYTCVVSNANGTVTSDPITLSVLAGSPQITAQPQAQSIYENQSASMFVSATVPQGYTLAYQWQYSLDAGANWANSGLATSGGMNSSSIQVTFVGAVLDGMLLRCIVTAQQSGISVTSSSAQLTVTPVFVSQPQDIQNTIGNAAFSCELAFSAPCKLQRSVNFGAFADVDENYVGMTNVGSGATAQTGTQIQLQGNPQEPYIYESRYRIKVDLGSSGFTYTTPANVSRLLRPNSISIKTPARAGGTAQLLQEIPNTGGLVFSWIYGGGSYIQETFIPTIAGYQLGLSLSLQQTPEAGTVDATEVTVAPALEIISLTVPASRKQLEGVGLSVVVGSVDAAANLGYSWSSDTYVGPFATTKDVSGSAYHPGYQSPNESDAVAEGDAWYRNGSIISCIVTDTLGNTATAYAPAVSVTDIEPVVASGYKTVIYKIVGGMWTLSEFEFSVSSNNAPVGRRAIGVSETLNDGSPVTYSLENSASQSRSQVNSTDSVVVKFFNEFGETAPITLYVNWGTPATSSASAFLPTTATSFVPVNLTNVSSSNFENGTGSKPETFAWRILESGSVTQNAASSLPSSSSDPVSGSYYITFLSQGTFEVELVATNPYGSYTSTQTITVS